MSSPSQDHAPSTGVKPQRDGESATTKAADWHAAKRAGKRLPEHELLCIQCGEPSVAPVCCDCTETQLEAEVHQ